MANKDGIPTTDEINGIILLSQVAGEMDNVIYMESGSSSMDGIPSPESINRECLVEHTKHAEDIYNQMLNKNPDISLSRKYTLGRLNLLTYFEMLKKNYEKGEEPKEWIVNAAKNKVYELGEIPFSHGNYPAMAGFFVEVKDMNPDIAFRSANTRIEEIYTEIQNTEFKGDEYVKTIDEFKSSLGGLIEKIENKENYESEHKSFVNDFDKLKKIDGMDSIFGKMGILEMMPNENPDVYLRALKFLDKVTTQVHEGSYGSAKYFSTISDIANGYKDYMQKFSKLNKE